jgi:uncharacterized protein YutE (UPF0331/DUF86 family)
MSPLNKSTIEKKLLNITKEISFLESLLKENISDKNPTRDHYALLHSIQNALSGAIDTSQHIVSEELKIIPESYSDSIIKLATAGYLDTDFAKKFSEAARFRNKLVHVYEEINMDYVIKNLPDMIKELKVFVKSVAEKVSEPES